MTDSLVTPWTGSLLGAPAPVVPFDPARLPALPPAAAAGPWPGSDALTCPWSGRAMPLPGLPTVRALPTLGPDVPVQRTAAEQAPVSA